LFVLALFFPCPARRDTASFLEDGKEEDADPQGRLGGSASEPQQAAAAAGGGGAAADAALREQANKKKKKSKKKKSGRPGVVEQLKAKASVEGEGGSWDGGVAVEGADSDAGKGKDAIGAVPPEMGLLDAVAAMILGEILERIAV